MRKKLIFSLKLIIGLAIFLYLIYRIGAGDIFSTLSKVNLNYFVLAVLLTFPGWVIGMINIRLLLKSINASIGFFKLLKFYLLSWAFGLFIPGKLGEFSLVYFLQKEDIKIGEGMSVALLDKIISIFSLILISVIAGVFFFKHKSILLIIALYVFGLVFFLLALLSGRIRRFVVKYILGDFAKKFENFSKTFFYILRKRFFVVVINLLITLIKWFLFALVIFVLFLSLGIQVNFFYVFLITSLIKLVGLIPISVNGIGIDEFFSILFYGMIGIIPAVIISLQLMKRIISYSFAVLIFIFLKWK
ncbi:MAG: lysylphosphatidylglycerol synthase transmembrane domain-containing protein [Candidatus Woesearchaeota archaeon]